MILWLHIIVNTVRLQYSPTPNPDTRSLRYNKIWWWNSCVRTSPHWKCISWHISTYTTYSVMSWHKKCVIFQKSASKNIIFQIQKFTHMNDLLEKWILFYVPVLGIPIEYSLLESFFYLYRIDFFFDHYSTCRSTCRSWRGVCVSVWYSLVNLYLIIWRTVHEPYWNKIIQFENVTMILFHTHHENITNDFLSIWFMNGSSNY